MAASASLKIVIISSSERPCSEGCSTKSQSPERISRAMFGYFAVSTTTGFMGRHYTAPMSAMIGRLFQLIGMIILPIGLLTGLLKDNVNMEVRLLFIGGAIFLIGWLIAKKTPT